MELFHLIEVKTLCATSTKGTRFKLISHRFGDSVIIAKSYMTSTDNQVLHWFESRGVEILGVVEMHAKPDSWGTSRGLLIKAFKPLSEISALADQI
jgi:hypothetical protein